MRLSPVASNVTHSTVAQGRQLHPPRAREDSERIRERHALLYLDAKSSLFDFFCNTRSTWWLNILYVGGVEDCGICLTTL